MDPRHSKQAKILMRPSSKRKYVTLLVIVVLRIICSQQQLSSNVYSECSWHTIIHLRYVQDFDKNPARVIQLLPSGRPTGDSVLKLQKPERYQVQGGFYFFLQNEHQQILHVTKDNSIQPRVTFSDTYLSAFGSVERDEKQTRQLTPIDFDVLWMRSAAGWLWLCLSGGSGTSTVVVYRYLFMQ